MFYLNQNTIQMDSSITTEHARIEKRKKKNENA